MSVHGYCVLDPDCASGALHAGIFTISKSKTNAYPLIHFTALKYVLCYHHPPFFAVAALSLSLVSSSCCLSPSLSGHVTQRQTCGNCSDAVKPKASLEPQRKQQKQTLEQPQSVDTNLCICQADLDLFKRGSVSP